jgi:ribosomal-protein-alanine N-acetyltransferase
MALIVRKMMEADIPEVYQIEKNTFACPWSLRSFYDEIASPERALYHVVEAEDGKIVAFGGMWLILDEGHITNIAVDSDYRRMGIGRLLVKKMLIGAKEQKLEQVTLEVRESNFAAQKLYQQFGFEVLGRRKAYYSDNSEDALIMWADVYKGEESWNCFEE